MAKVLVRAHPVNPVTALGYIDEKIMTKDRGQVRRRRHSWKSIHVYPYLRRRESSKLHPGAISGRAGLLPSSVYPTGHHRAEIAPMSRMSTVACQNQGKVPLHHISFYEIR